MPPRVQLKPHLTASEIKHLYRHAQDKIEARRWHLVHLVAQQWTVRQAAQLIGMNYDYAKEIIGRYNQQGPLGVKNRSQQGQPSPRSLLTPEQQQELKQALQAASPDGERWTGPKVARWIAAKTGKQVWAQRGWDYLQRLKDEEDACD
ncbi:helix-turn-helix domain-containing protein [Stenomitos frigidus]|uniref:Transcriptional regulator n=1 Tax=Stenomitos frigidus ULC18 TaxID=2107698 RepID=A0A2T1E9K0_9CYAN|nr:helix-turn-helix domain-containing protein [Stenomitos frigidus]PSB29429.1 transcriptional regulator [Stenomitos frigidus ULC18]